MRYHTLKHLFHPGIGRLTDWKTSLECPCTYTPACLKKAVQLLVATATTCFLKASPLNTGTGLFPSPSPLHFPSIAACLVFSQCHSVCLGPDWHGFVGVGSRINSKKDLEGKVLQGTHCTSQSDPQSRRLPLHFSQVITAKQANK